MTEDSLLPLTRADELPPQAINQPPASGVDGPSVLQSEPERPVRESHREVAVPQYERLTREDFRIAFRQIHFIARQMERLEDFMSQVDDLDAAIGGVKDGAAAVASASAAIIAAITDLENKNTNPDLTPEITQLKSLGGDLNTAASSLTGALPAPAPNPAPSNAGVVPPPDPNAPPPAQGTGDGSAANATVAPSNPSVMPDTTPAAPATDPNQPATPGGLAPA